MNDRNSKNNFVPSGFFAFRTPLLPFDELLGWGEGLEAPLCGSRPNDEDLTRLEKALAADRIHLRHRLRGIAVRAEVRDALFVASPDLDESFDHWLRDPGSERGQKVEGALVRYFARMAGRATPFGLFAGCSVGSLGAETRLVIEERARYQRHTRLDMDYVVTLADGLGRDPTMRNSVCYHPNTSLYARNGRLRYAEVRRNGKGWSHHAVALESSDYLAATLARARPGAPLPALAAALLEQDSDASQAEAEEYIGELIENQVLQSEFCPAVTGPEPVPGLVSQLRDRGAALSADRLDHIREALAAIDAVGVGAAPESYRRIARVLEDLPAKVELPRLFQVDMVKPAGGSSLGHAIVAEILEGVGILQRLAPRPAKDRLTRFREAFLARYESREVPLVQALDTETGVGFDSNEGAITEASSLLEGLTFPQPAEETASWGKRETLLLGKLSEALAQGSLEIVLETGDLNVLANPDPPPLPDAFAVMATLAASSETALAGGDFRVLLGGVFGPSGARLLGRFCHADATLNRHVELHLRAEEKLQPDAVFAEIVHLPEGRLGNILSRPALRNYEIPYLGRASVPPECQLPISDLLVSIVGTQIVLRSLRLGKRIIPRLTSAHNYHPSQGFYRFLCALQDQGIAGQLGWDWGPLRAAPFLPRVVTGRLVLSRAHWNASKQELHALGQGSEGERFRNVQAWRIKRKLPRWIAWADGDNELPIDLDNLLCVETLIDLVKGREGTALVEIFPGPDQMLARGPEGRFTHELVVPFVRRGDTATGGHSDGETGRQSEGLGASNQPRPAVTPPVRRSFPPGSEWLYAKLYTGVQSAEQVLLDLIRPLTQAVLKSGAADRWFFIRYGDPEWHLRLRLHGAPEILQTEAVPMLQASLGQLLDDGLLWRVQMDTYEREVERYGGDDGMALAERIFQADSGAVLALVEMFPEDSRGETRWRLALCGMDLLLEDFGFDLDTKRLVIRQAREAFTREFRADAQLKHQLGDKFRKERRGLEILLDPVRAGTNVLAPGLAVLRRRSERLVPVLAELKGLERSGRLSQSLADLAPSFLHMHANRLLRSAHRAQELVLYDFLARLYESQTARAGP